MEGERGRKVRAEGIICVDVSAMVNVVVIDRGTDSNRHIYWVK